MDADQILKLCQAESFPEAESIPELVETHISWIILTDSLAFKIKKPVTFSFLDFSKLQQRKYFCHREVELNQRLTTGIYIDVQPVVKKGDKYRIGLTEKKEGTVIDYAVQMNRVDSSLQMDRVLEEGGGTAEQMHRLAEKVAAFHRKCEIFRIKDTNEILNLFEDLNSIKSFLQNTIGLPAGEMIDFAINRANVVNLDLQDRMRYRLDKGYVRDVHGDLHTGNIFLLEDPQPFDCIEYNDDFRQIDVLNEVAFLCMDLEYYNRPGLAEAFLTTYLEHFPVMETSEDRRLFTFYKSYRANVRGKVIGLQARKEEDSAKKEKLLQSCLKYLKLMEHYLSMLD